MSEFPALDAAAATRTYVARRHTSMFREEALRCLATLKRARLVLLEIVELDDDGQFSACQTDRVTVALNHARAALAEEYQK